MQHPMYTRRFEAANLLSDHPPRFQHPHKSALFRLAYPEGDQPAPASIDVTRWPRHVCEPLDLKREVVIDVRPNFYDYVPASDASASVEWHVNFADPHLFVAYGSGLFAQDEMQVAEHPLLASVRGALLSEGLPALTADEYGGTPILVTNVERRLTIATDADSEAGRPAGLYGNRFAQASFETICRATRRIDPATYSNFIAMAAPSGGIGEYAPDEIEQIFATAYTGFAAAVWESTHLRGEGVRAVVHTGYWGCGAFGGNRLLMIALQVLAARSAGVDRLILHVGDVGRGIEDAGRGLQIAADLARQCGSAWSVDALVERAAELGFRWGVSDGN